MKKFISIIFLLVLFSHSIGNTQEKRKFYDPIVKTFSFILENTIVLGIKIALIPLKPIFDYIFQQKVINRFVTFTYLDKERKKRIYPSFNLTSGRGSYIGFDYKHKDFLSNNSQFHLNYKISVSLNNTMRLSYGKSNFLFPKTYFITSLQQVVSTQSLIVSPYTQLEYFHSNYTTNWKNTFNVLNKNKINPYIGFSVKRIFYGIPEFETLKIKCDSLFFSDFNGRNCLDRRGIGSVIYDFNYFIGLKYNTINNPYTPHKGVYFNLFLENHITTEKHNYHKWGITLRQFIFLGHGKYRNIQQEKKAFRKFKVKEALSHLKFNYLRDQFLNKQIFIIQIRIKQSQEQRGHDLPINALSNLSNSTPLRGYSGILKSNKNLSSLSVEYRFPISYFVETVLFADFADANESFSDINLSKVKRSFGFGFRMSRKDIFLFRLQFGFRKWSSPQINVSLSQVY